MRYLALFIILILFSCTRHRVYEAYEDVPGRSWALTDTLTFQIDIQDTTSLYNLFVNIRHTGMYNYSNLWLQLYETSPIGQRQATRFEFTLAERDGRWRGHGLGNFIDHQFQVRREFRFNRAGEYTLQLVHDMREDEVEHLVSAGIRLEKVLTR